MSRLDCASSAGHLIDQRQIASILRSGGRLSPSDQSANLVWGNPVAALRIQRQRTEEVLEDIDLTATITTPGGDVQVGGIIGQAALEPIVHAWDLAAGTCTLFVPDDHIARRLLEQLLPIANTLAVSGIYGTRQSYPGDDAYGQLLAVLGRNPNHHWSAGTP